MDVGSRKGEGWGEVGEDIFGGLKDVGVYATEEENTLFFCKVANWRINPCKALFGTGAR